MVKLDVFDNLGPFWVHLDTFGPFQTKINLSPHKDKVVFGWGAFEQKIIFCLKWSKRVEPFWTPLDHFWLLFDWCVLFGTPCTKTCLVVSNRRGNRKGRGKLGRLDHWPKGIEAKDGVWRDYYTGEQLEKYTKPWRNLNQDKNGDEAYNCINFYVKEAVTRSWTEWNCIGRPRGCPCAYNYPPLLHLRCFCPGTLVDR